MGYDLMRSPPTVVIFAVTTRLNRLLPALRLGNGNA